MARTDGDTWDLASSVGATATGVAASRALASKQPDPLIDDPFAEPLVQGRRPRHFNKIADGELDFDDDPLLEPPADVRADRRAHTVISTTSSPARPRRAFGRRSSWPRASTPGPTGCRGRRTRSCSRSTSHR